MKYHFNPSWLNDDAEEYDPPHIKRFTHNVEELLQKYTDDQCKVFTRMMLEARACGVMDAIAAFCLSRGSVNARIQDVMEKLEVDPKEVAEYCQYIIDTEDDED